MTKNELKAELEAAVASIKSAEGVIDKIWRECSAFDLSEEQKVWNDSLAAANQKILDAWEAFEIFQRWNPRRTRAIIAIGYYTPASTLLRRKGNERVFETIRDSLRSMALCDLLRARLRDS